MIHDNENMELKCRFFCFDKYKSIKSDFVQFYKELEDVLNYGSRLTEYATSYLVGNQITFSGDSDVVDDQTSSTALGEITSQDGATCTVKGITLGYVQLKVSLVSDPTVYLWQRIRVKGLI
ncbi:hypothetical protein [Paenibacillus antibioticophila]|uniref:hypothetical protein n=1 Tax=Paenibacillus antibioticophila TaxID=1274374 RepID=UPI000AF46582|nr:hypothetical protein [Paenibacillus antibioticophila]